MQPRPRVYYGWYIAWSYFFMNFYWGGALLAGFSALFLPISESFGLSALLVTTAISLRHGMAVVAAPVVGYIFDRRGPRLLMVVATLVTAGGSRSWHSPTRPSCYSSHSPLHRLGLLSSSPAPGRPRPPAGS